MRLLAARPITGAGAPTAAALASPEVRRRCNGALLVVTVRTIPRHVGIDTLGLQPFKLSGARILPRFGLAPPRRGGADGEVVQRVVV